MLWKSAVIVILLIHVAAGKDEKWAWKSNRRDGSSRIEVKDSPNKKPLADEVSDLNFDPDITSSRLGPKYQVNEQQDDFNPDPYDRFPNRGFGNGYDGNKGYGGGIGGYEGGVNPGFGGGINPGFGGGGNPGYVGAVNPGFGGGGNPYYEGGKNPGFGLNPGYGGGINPGFGGSIRPGYGGGIDQGFGGPGYNGINSGFQRPGVGYRLDGLGTYDGLESGYRPNGFNGFGPGYGNQFGPGYGQAGFNRPYKGNHISNGILVGPGGPTGSTGRPGRRPFYKPGYDQNAILTGPNGPSGIIGPGPIRGGHHASNGVLVGPDGPYDNYGHGGTPYNNGNGGYDDAFQGRSADETKKPKTE